MADEQKKGLFSRPPVPVPVAENLDVNAEFNPSLARGLSYYNGTVIEVYLKNSSVKSAVCEAF